MNTPSDFSSSARAAAIEILAEHGGTAYLSDLLALAYMRGNVAGFREAIAAEKAMLVAQDRATTEAA